MKNKIPSKKKSKISTKKGGAKEEKLEEEVREAEKEIGKRKSRELELEEFQEFLEEEPEFQRTSPSLTKINSSPESIINLEQNLTSTSSGRKGDEEKDSFKYVAEAMKNDEPKYLHYEGISTDFLPKTEIENIGKTDLLERREVRFAESPEARLGEIKSIEKYVPVERFEREKLGKENPLERREVKYKPLS